MAGEDNTGTLGIGANGLPLAPNVQTYSPETTTTRVQETPDWQKAVGRQEQSYTDLATATGAESAAKVSVAQQQADLYKAQAAKEAIYLREREARRAELNQRIQESHKVLGERIAKASEEPTRYWDDKTSEQKSYARVGIILSALGAGITGGENKAISYINNEIDRDVKLKQARAERLMKLAEQSRGMLSDAYRQRADELADMDAQRAAGWDIVARQAEIMAKTMVPVQMKAQGEAAVATIRQEAAKARLAAEENRKTQVVSQSAHTTTTEGLGKAAGRAAPSANDVVEYSTAEELEKKATRLEELTKKGEVPTPEQMAQYLDNTNVIVGRQLQESHGNGAVLVGKIGRALDALPSSSYPPSMTAGQREWMRLHTEMIHQMAVKKFGQSAMSNPESYHEFVDPLMYGRGNTREEGIEKALAGAQQMHTTWGNLRTLSKAGMQEDRAEAMGKPAPGTKTATAKPTVQPAMPAKLTPRQALEMAKARLQADPNDKAARKVLEALKAQVGGGQ
jgi:hypothetical protein